MYSYAIIDWYCDIFSVRPATKELIAVSPNVDCLSISNEQYNFVNVDKSPALSELVQGRYVAYVEKIQTALIASKH